MAVTLNSRPSTWSAVKNPLVYKLRREDYAWTQVNNNGGFAQFQFNGVDLTSYFQAGNSIIVLNASGAGSVRTVSGSSFSAGNTLVDTSYSFAGVAGYTILNNLSKRTDYHVEIEVFQASDDQSLTDGVVFSFTPGTDGVAYCDISQIVKAYLTAEWNSLAGLNEAEADTSLKVYIKYQEYYDGALIGAQTSDSASPIHGVLAGLQIPSANGNNLTDYVPADYLKKFLTVFERPKIWRGYPATLSFIFPSGINYNVIRTQHNAAGTTVASGTEFMTGASDPDSGHVNRLNLLYNFAIVDEAKTFKVNFDILGVAHTEILTFDVEDVCNNPVMLVWKNSLGGDSFWMFEHSQEAGYNLSGSKKAKRMTLFAEHLTLNQWEALNELNTLGEVYAENIIEFTSSVNKTHKRDGAQVYVLDASGNKTGVIVIPTTSVINTKDETHSIEIEIELPQRIE
jgi:hypothetical protein